MFEKELTARFGSKAQELLMQDILDGMEDFVTKLGYRTQPCEFEIIPLTRAVRSGKKDKQKDITANTDKQEAEIISFKEKKEEFALRMSA